MSRQGLHPCTLHNPEMSQTQDWRRALIVLTVALVLETITFSHVSAFVPLFLGTELSLPPAEVSFWTGIIAGAPLAIALCLAPFWGVWAERYSPKLIIVRAQAFELVVYLGFVFAQTLPQFFAAALLLGLTYGNIAVLMAVVAHVTPALRVQSGQPYGRVINAGAAHGLNYGTQRILAEPIDSRTQDDIVILDLRAERRFKLGKAGNLSGFFDIYNIGNSDAANNINWVSGSTFEVPSAIIGPRIMRFGVKYDW